MFQVDSDGQFLVEEFEPALVAPRRRGSRARRPASRGSDRCTPPRALAESIARTVSVLAGRRLRDSNIPFRLVRRELWHDFEPLIARDARAPSIMVSLGAARRGLACGRGAGDASAPRPGYVDAFAPPARLVQPARAARADRRSTPASTRSRRGWHSSRTRWRDAVSSRGRCRRHPPASATRGQRTGASRVRSVRAGLRGSSCWRRSCCESSSSTAKPFHHDESEHAWFTWLLVTGKGYHYDPVFHGPVQFYVMSLAVPADRSRRPRGPAGACARRHRRSTALPYLLRRQLGAAGGARGRGRPLPQPELPLLLALRPRGHLRGLSDARADRRRLPIPRPAAALAPGASSSDCSRSASRRRRRPTSPSFIGGIFFVGLAVWEIRPGASPRRGSLIRGRPRGRSRRVDLGRRRRSRSSSRCSSRRS